MALLDQPWNIQMDWSDTAGFPWNTTDANYLNTQIKRIEIDRWAFRGQLRTNTCRITAYDPSAAVRPIKTSSSLYPNVVLGRRGRVVAQVGAGTGNWQPWFFGYVSDYEPNATDPPRPEVVVTLDSPLTVLSSREITLPPSDHPYVYKADDTDHSALWLLLKEAGLWGANCLDLDPVGEVVIPGIWGDGTKTFGEWLAELCGYAGTIVADEPRLAVAGGDADWALHWFKPLTTAAATFHYSAVAGDLEPAPQIVYGADAAA